MGCKDHNFRKQRRPGTWRKSQIQTFPAHFFLLVKLNIWRFPEMEVPPWLDGFCWENPTKNEWFRGTPIFGNTHMSLYPFAGTDVFSFLFSATKLACILQVWARFDTKFLKLSHHVLSMDERLHGGLMAYTEAWPGDATRVEPTFEDHPPIFSAKKRSSPLEFMDDTSASTSSSHCFCMWSWTYVTLYPFLHGQICIFSFT